MVSKMNTVAQILFAGLVLGSLGLKLNAGWLMPAMMAAVTVLTLLSIAAYVREWVHHMSNGVAHH